MRYDDWDVILFPRDSHVPIQEFKTACFVSQVECELHRYLVSFRLACYHLGSTTLTHHRRAPTADINLLHQLTATLDPISYLTSFLASRFESLSAPRVPTQKQSKGSFQRPGHCGRGQTLVSLE